MSRHRLSTDPLLECNYRQDRTHLRQLILISTVLAKQRATRRCYNRGYAIFLRTALAQAHVDFTPDSEITQNSISSQDLTGWILHAELLELFMRTF